MRNRFRDLWLGDVEDTLEFLRDVGLELAREFRAERPSGDAFENIAKIKRRTQEFFVRVRSKDDIFGVARGTRILRHGAKVVPAIDNIGMGAELEASIEWLDQVVENIEHELNAIDQKRILWMTVAAAVFAALAVVVGIAAIIISLFLRS
jgi:hypothetical protein